MIRIYLLILIVIFSQIRSQEDLIYQTPPEEILKLVDVSMPPRVLMDEEKKIYDISLSRYV